MALYDRDYAFQRTHRPGQMTATGWLVIINVGVFLLGMMFSGLGRASGGGSPLNNILHTYGSFSTYSFVSRWEVWRLLTFQFLHADILHLAFNMFGLWTFGRMVEEYLGFKKYLAFYLVCGIFGGLSYLLLNLAGYICFKQGWMSTPIVIFNDPRTPLVGASAGVFGVIMAAAFIAPNLQVQLMIPPIPLRLRTLAYAFLIIAGLTILFRWNNAGGEAAHLGGAAAGAFFIRRSHLLRDFFDIWNDSRKEKKNRGISEDTRGRMIQQRSDLDTEVDRILAKVKESGVQSLTEREKASLQKATSLQRGTP